MDELLAQIYGTGQDEDLEKTAAAELLVKLAEDAGVDLDELSDEEVAELINELYTGDSDDEATEKLAEADFLGRVMAHSMVQELGNIEKWAEEANSVAPLPAEAEPAKKPGRIRRFFSSWGGRMRRGGTDILGAFRTKGIPLGERLGLIGAGVGRLSPELLTAGGAAALARAIYKHRKRKGRMRKHSSAISEELLNAAALERAQEMLVESGWADIEKTAGMDDVGQEIERRALMILEANGYPVRWYE